MKKEVLSVKKFKINDIAEEIEQVSSDWNSFFNTKTGEFEHYSSMFGDEEDDPEKYEGEEYISLPSQYDIHEYQIMSDFADFVTDKHKQELLYVSLEGKGAFRRFKDTLIRTGLQEEWYAFKREAFIEIAKEWCENNNISYQN